MRVDRGSNCVSLAYSDRIIELGGTPSVGSKGDRHDDAVAEAQFPLIKTELIKKRRPWRIVEQVEPATLEWVSWFNNPRLHSELDYQTPPEIEAAYFAENNPALATATHEKPSEQRPRGFKWESSDIFPMLYSAGGSSE